MRMRGGESMGKSVRVLSIARDAAESTKSVGFNRWDGFTVFDEGMFVIRKLCRDWAKAIYSDNRGMHVSGYGIGSGRLKRAMERAREAGEVIDDIVLMEVGEKKRVYEFRVWWDRQSREFVACWREHYIKLGGGEE